MIWLWPQILPGILLDTFGKTIYATSIDTPLYITVEIYKNIQYIM